MGQKAQSVTTEWLESHLELFELCCMQTQTHKKTKHIIH